MAVIICSFLLSLISFGFCQGSPVLTITIGACGLPTTLTCASNDTIQGDNYVFYRDDTAIYDQTSNGQVLSQKYNGTSTNGSVTLIILNTGATDAATYSCNHNFLDSNTVVLQLTCPVAGKGGSRTNKSGIGIYIIGILAAFMCGQRVST